jgi:hypothetical protein
MAAVLLITFLLSPAVSNAYSTRNGRNWIEMASPYNSVKYTVTYHPNEGVGQTIEESVETNSDYTIKAQGYKRKNFIPIGWNTKPDCSGKSYLNGQVINIEGNIVLYVMWSPIV